jgi:hypothetical protein
MASKKSTAAQLAEKLVAVLEAQRGFGKDSYPLTLQRLVQLTDAQAPAELIDKAVANKAFKERVIVAHMQNRAAPVALVEDGERLAASRMLLEFALALVCTPDKPAATLAALKATVQKNLRKPFEDAVQRQINENSLPPTVECLTAAKGKVLHPRHLPMPKDPTAELAEKLLAVLGAQRQLGNGSYPLALKRLIELTSPDVKPKLVADALRHLTLHGKLVLVQVNKQQALIALAQDRQQLVASDLMLECLLRAKRKSTTCAFPVEALLPKKSELFRSFGDAVLHRMEVGSLPPCIGWILIGKKRYVFLMEDVQRGHLKANNAPLPDSRQPADNAGRSREAPTTFARDFDEIFNQIDRQKGGHNFISLVELRRRLPLERHAFDAELRKLRMAGRYTLSAAEGRHGLHPEEQEAGIIEDGALLLFVSRRTA